jgi:hypothetical protein
VLLAGLRFMDALAASHREFEHWTKSRRRDSLQSLDMAKLYPADVPQGVEMPLVYLDQHLIDRLQAASSDLLTSIQRAK